MTDLLDAVDIEDKPLVKDVITVLNSLKICSGWVVNVVPKGYEILGWINNSKEDVTISLDDLDLLQQVNRVRIPIPTIKLLANSNKSCVRIIVISHKEPVMVSEQTLLRVKKRKTWFGIY